VAELIARAGAEVAARQNGAAHEQALLELAGGRMPPLADALARAHEMTAAHGGFARLDALTRAAPSDTVAVDTALTALRALGVRAATPAATAAPAARRDARPEKVAAPTPAPAIAPAPAPAPGATAAVAPAPVPPVPAPAPAATAAPAPAPAPRAELPAGVPADIDEDLLTGDAELDAELLTGDVELDTGLLTGDEELDAILLGDEPELRESQTEITTNARALERRGEPPADEPELRESQTEITTNARALERRGEPPADEPELRESQTEITTNARMLEQRGEPPASEPGADAVAGPGESTLVQARGEHEAARGPAPEVPSRHDEPLADALPAAPAAAAAASPSPADALDGWLDDELGDVEELAFSIDGSGRTSGPTSGPIKGPGERGTPGRAGDALFADEPTALRRDRSAASLHEESTAVLPEVRGAVDGPLPPLPIDGDAIPVLAEDERASAMALPSRDARLLSDYDFRQADDDFSDDPPVQIVTRPGSIVTRPGSITAGAGRESSDMLTQEPVDPRAADGMLDSALEELELAEALELDDIEIVENESQPVAAASPPAQRLAEGTPPYPPSSPPAHPAAEGYPARQPTPVSVSALPASSPRLPLPGLPPPPGQAAPSLPPPFPTQPPYPTPGAPPPGYPGYPPAPQGHPYPPPPGYPQQPGHAPPAPYPADPAHAQPPPYPQSPAYPQAPSYPVAPADAQHRPTDDDDDGKKRGFFGRIFKK
jgi:hypothetical protein